MISEASSIHVSVLLEETVSAVEPRSGGFYIDATCGLGGHTEALLEACSPDGRVLSVDRDPRALEFARKRLERFGSRLQLLQANFSELAGLTSEPVDGLIADLGVSSLQLDDPNRGFSFRADVPLDMRMGDTGKTALDLLEEVDESELTQILKEYGELQRPRKVARAILRARQENKLSTTKDLVEAVEAVIPKKPGLHPATLVFQAIRIAVNRELDELETLLEQLPELITEGGKVAIISFHSLEDRRVKQFFRGPPISPELRNLPIPPPKNPFKPLVRRPVTPSEDELANNPRSRSAKLRIAERRVD